MIKQNKREKTLNWLLSGKSISGREFGKILFIENYRDIIYLLRKQLKNNGIEISDTKESHSDGLHKRWFMTVENIRKYQQINK